MQMSQGQTGSLYRQGQKSTSPQPQIQPRPIFEMPPELMQSKGPLLRSGNFAGGTNSNSFQQPTSQKQPISQDYNRNYEDMGKQDIEPPNFGKTSLKNSYSMQNQYAGYSQTPPPYQQNFEPLVKPEQVRNSSNYNMTPNYNNYQTPIIETNFQNRPPEQKNLAPTQSFNNNSYGAPPVKYDTQQPYYNYQQTSNNPESIPIAYGMNNIPQDKKKTFDEVNEAAPEPEYEAVCKVF